MVTIREAKGNEAKLLLSLYKKVAQFPNGIIRTPEEITENYINDFMSKSHANGCMLMAYHGEQLVGEIHAYTPPLKAFRHLLTDLTIVVDTQYQGKGIGKELFTTFLKKVRMEYPHIMRVELFTREHNLKNVAFYKKLGFVNEGRQDRKIYVSEQAYHTPLHMAWFNPNFQ